MTTRLTIFALMALILSAVVSPVQAQGVREGTSVPDNRLYARVSLFCLADPDDPNRPNASWAGLREAMVQGDWEIYRAIMLDPSVKCVDFRLSFGRPFIMEIKARHETFQVDGRCVQLIHGEDSEGTVVFTWIPCRKEN